MIPDRDIWAAVLLMAKRYKTDAMLETAARADQAARGRRLAGRCNLAPSST